MLGLNRVKKLQEEVDQIDRMIISLLLERFQLVHEILAIKEEEAMGLEDPVRDQLTIEKVGLVKGNPETQLALMRIFRAILDWGIKCYQKKPDQKNGFLH
jgi:chorismate mutase